MKYKKVRKIDLIALAILVLILLIVKPSPLYYEIEPVSAKIIDVNTKKPIQDASVEVIWGLVKSSYHSSSSFSGWLGFQQSLTDEQGIFRVPGWTRWWRKWFSSQRIDHASPEIRILKSGYIPERLSIPEIIDDNFSFFVEKEKETSFTGKQVVSGLSERQQIVLKKLPENPLDRYNAFHKTFRLPISESTCKELDSIGSNVVVEIYKEQKYALQAGLDLNLSSEARKDILNFETPDFDSCLRLVNYLSLQHL